MTKRNSIELSILELLLTQRYSSPPPISRGFLMLFFLLLTHQRKIKHSPDSRLWIHVRTTDVEFSTYWGYHRTYQYNWPYSGFQSFNSVNKMGSWAYHNHVFCVMCSRLLSPYSQQLKHWFSFQCSAIRLSLSWHVNCRAVTNKIISLVLIGNATIFWLPFGWNKSVAVEFSY